MTSPTDNLLRLKSVLFRLKEQGDISPSDYTTLTQQLDSQLHQATDKWPTVALDELVAWSSLHYPQIDLTPCTQLIQQKQLDEIIEAHFNCKQAGNGELLVKQWFPNLDSVPLNGFSWNELNTSLSQLFCLLKDNRTPFTQTVEACQRFFHPDSSLLRSAGLSEPNLDTLLSRLIDNKVISTFEAAPLSEDIILLKNHLIKARENLNRQFATSSFSEQDNSEKSAEFANQLAIAISKKSAHNPALEEQVIQWQGPFKAMLLNRWKQSITDDWPRRDGLIAACTGIDYKKNPSQWQTWVNRENEREKTGRAYLSELITEQQLYYDVGFVLSCQQLFDMPTLEANWLTPLHRLSKPKVIEVKPGVTPEKVKITPPSTPSNSKPSPEDEWSSHEIEDEIDHLEAAPKKHNVNDQIVDQQSTWSLYLKPFLSENWLGLIGISSLMIAWLFLSMWIWDKGPYYRLAAGAIPMLVISLCTGWITQFFHKLESRGTSRKAVELFACITLFSLPFNFLIDASLLSSGDTIGFVLSGAALFVHLSVIALLLGHWLQVPFNGNPRRYLLESSILLIIPTSISLVAPQWLPLSLSMVVFLAYIVAIRGFIRLDNTTERFPYFAIGSHFILAIVTLHIYHLMLPDPITIAILIELIALTLIFFFSANPAFVVTGGALALLGQGIGFITPEVLPFTLMLSIGFWLKLRQYYREYPWVNDVIVLHGFALAFSLFYLLNIPLVWLPLALFPFFLMTLWFEKWHCQTAIISITYLLPLYMVATTALGTNSDLRLVDLALLLLTGSYCYIRYSINNQLRYWLISFAILITAPLILFSETVLINPQWLCLYWSLLAAAWAILSPNLKDLFSYQHRTTLLWALTLVATASQMLFLLFASYQTFLLATIALTAIALFFAAKRSSSALPIYLLFILIGSLAYGIKQYYQLQSSSGISLVITACGLLLLARYLPLAGFSHTDEKLDRFFSSDFILRTTQFIHQPLKHTALFLVLLSMIKAALSYAPTSENGLLSLSLFIQTGLLIFVARQYASKKFSGLSLLPASALFLALVLSLPIEWMPIAIVIGLLLFSVLLDWLNQRDDSPLRQILQQYHRLLMTLSIPMGFIGYGLILFYGSAIGIVLYGGLILLLNHIYLCIRRDYRYSHVSFSHLLVIWSLAYLLYADISTFAASTLLPWLLGYAVILTIINLSTERRRSAHLSLYQRHSKGWLFMFSHLFALLTMTTAWLAYEDSTLMGYALLTIPLLIIANRSYQVRLPIIILATITVTIGLLITPDKLWALLFALLLFTGIQALLMFSRRFTWPIHAMDSQQPFMLQQASYVLYGLVIITLLTHLTLFLTLPAQASMSHAMLYLLIPFSMLLYKLLRLEHLSYLAITLFAYANCFMSLALLPWIQQQDLTIMHLLSGTLVISLLLLTSLGKIISRKELAA